MKIKKNQGSLHLVIGASRFGAAIAKYKAKAAKFVVVIDKDKNAYYKLGDNFPGTFIHGDATKTRTLNDANAISAKEIVIGTDDEDVNIFIANLLYIKYNKTNIYVRLDDDEKRKLIISSEIKIINPFMLSIKNYQDLFQSNKQNKNDEVKK